MNYEINKNIAKLIERLGITPYDFSKKIGNNRPDNIYNVVKCKVNISPKTLDKIITTYPEYRQFIITGNDDGSNLPTPAPLNATASYRLVPMYNMDARGGFENNEVVDTTEYIVDRIPFKDARQDDICVMITGNSMSPTYCAGSVVLLHPIDRWREFLELGQVYVIILEDGRRLIKELRTSEEDKKSNYLCRSHNPDVDPVELPKSMIRKVFIVAAMYSKTIL